MAESGLRLEKCAQVKTEMKSCRRGKARLCIYYDRVLCGALEEYENLSIEYVESQAHGKCFSGGGIVF